MSGKVTLDQEHLNLLKINQFKATTGKWPIVLRNPYTGEIYFVQKEGKS